jgi:hypothetical protein
MQRDAARAVQLTAFDRVEDLMRLSGDASPSAKAAEVFLSYAKKSQ